MTCDYEPHAHADPGATIDDLAQLTAAVAALTETVRLQALSIDRIEAHRTTIIGEISRRLREQGARTGRLEAAFDMFRPLATREGSR